MVNILLSRGIIGTGDIYIYLKEIIKPNHKVLLVNFSFYSESIKDKKQYDEISGIEGTYTKRIIDSFFPYGIDPKNIDILHYYNDNHDTAVKKIKTADIIYFPGGAPDEMMIRINEFGLKETFEKSEKIFIGSSAGAMIQFADYHITPDHEYKKFSYQNGLNLISDFFVEVHYKNKRKTRRSLYKVIMDHDEPVILIPDAGCVIKKDSRIILIGNAKIINDKKNSHTS